MSEINWDFNFYIDAVTLQPVLSPGLTTVAWPTYGACARGQDTSGEKWATETAGCDKDAASGTASTIGLTAL